MHYVISGETRIREATIGKQLAGTDRHGLELLRELGHLAEEMKSSLTVLRSSSTDVFAKVSYLAFFARLVGVFRAFDLLVNQGCGIEAKLLLRPFGETFVDWLYIESDPENLGKRYIMYQSAADLQRLRDEGLIAEANAYMRQHGDTMKEFCDTYEKKKVPREWCDQNMKDKAALVELTNYYPIYRHHSNLIHNNPLMLRDYVNWSVEGTLKLKTQAESAGLRNNIGLICGAFIVCLDKANRQFDLQREAEVQALNIRVTEYMEAVKAVRGSITSGKGRVR